MRQPGAHFHRRLLTGCAPSIFHSPFLFHSRLSLLMPVRCGISLAVRLLMTDSPSLRTLGLGCAWMAPDDRIKRWHFSWDSSCSGCVSEILSDMAAKGWHVGVAPPEDGENHRDKAQVHSYQLPSPLMLKHGPNLCLSGQEGVGGKWKTVFTCFPWMGFVL